MAFVLTFLICLWSFIQQNFDSFQYTRPILLRRRLARCPFEKHSRLFEIRERVDEEPAFPLKALGLGALLTVGREVK
jgi:hypothetical protein